MNVNSAFTELELCNQSINSWLQKGLWSAVAMAAILMAFQVGLYICTNFVCTFILPLSLTPIRPHTHNHTHTHIHITAFSRYYISIPMSHDSRNTKLQWRLPFTTKTTLQNCSSETHRCHSSSSLTDSHTTRVPPKWSLSAGNCTSPPITH